MKRLALKVADQISRNVVLIDGKQLAYKTNYAGSGELKFHQIKTGLFYGFFNSMRSLAKRFGTGDFIILWDGDGSRRSAIYPHYKITRHQAKVKMSAKELALKTEFRKQYESLMDACRRLGFASYILEGFEADDIFGLFVNQFSNVGETIMVTSDEDMFQLIRPGVIQFDTKKKIRKDVRWFKEQKMGIDPPDWAWVKAAAGCKTDDVEGIVGIGEKTAIKYLLDPDSCSKRQRGLIENDEGQKIIERNLRLVTLPMPDCAHEVLPYRQTDLDMNQWTKMCEQLGFRQFLNRYEDDFYMFCKEEYED
jgi:5'-3' exonuclease